MKFEEALEKTKSKNACVSHEMTTEQIKLNPKFIENMGQGISDHFSSICNKYSEKYAKTLLHFRLRNV